MRCLFAAMLVASPLQAGDAVQFPGQLPLGFQISIDGKSPDAAWSAFLDKLFDHFDRDGGGTLSKPEAARVFALPLADGTEAKLDAAKEYTKEQFREHWRKAGFVPVAVRIASPAMEAMKLGDALAKLLDRDGDGRVSPEELNRLPGLLRRCDENEDEVLASNELLAAVEAKPLPPAGVKLVDGAKDGPILWVPLVGKPSTNSKSLQLAADGTRIAFPGGTCSLSISKDGISLRGTREFLLAQFQAISGGKPAAKAAFEDDPSAQALAALYDSADCDGDGKLTEKELEAFFDLIEAGVNCRVLVAVSDRGRNLFDLVDADGNGSLDGAELARAAKELNIADGIPATFKLTVSRGVPSAAFGPVPLGTASKPKPPMIAPAKRGPAWFQAMDKNADGFVSAAEFLGTPALFKTFDADGDGRLSPAEAAAAERK